MDHSNYLIELFNAQGELIGIKKRADIDKKTDIYRSVYVLLQQGENFLLSHIPANDALPKLYAGKWGVPAATILRQNETPHEAAERCLAQDFELEHLQPQLLGESLETLEGKEVPIFVVAFVARVNHWIDLSSETKSYSRQELIKALKDKPQDFSPVVNLIARRYLSTS